MESTGTEKLINKATIFGLLVALVGILYSHGYYRSFNVSFSELDSPFFVVIAQGVIKTFTEIELLLPIVFGLISAIYLESKLQVALGAIKLSSHFALTVILVFLAYLLCEIAIGIGRNEAHKDMQAETSQLPRITRLIVNGEDRAINGIDFRLVTANTSFIVYFATIEKNESEVQIYSIRVNRARVRVLETEISHEKES